MCQNNKRRIEDVAIFMAYVLTALGLFGDVVSFKQYDKEQREKESEQSVNKTTSDAMREGYVTAQMILSGMSTPVALHSKIRTSDEKVYAEIAVEAERLALAEAREKFGCRFLFRGDAWTNNSGVAAIMKDGANFVKIADNGSMLQYGDRGAFAELAWVDERKGVLFEELQKNEKYSNRIAEIKKRADELAAQKKAKEDEERRIDAIEINELFGLRFGSQEYKYCRTNYWDKLGLCEPSCFTRKVRLPNPEFGFETAEIRYVGDGYLKEIVAEKILFSSDGGKVSESALIEEQKKVVDAFSQRFGIAFKNDGVSTIYSFYQFARDKGLGFKFVLHVDRQQWSGIAKIRISADAHYVRDIPAVAEFEKISQETRASANRSSATNRYGRTSEEQKEYVDKLKVNSFWGFDFGSTQMCATSEARLQNPHGVFDHVKLEKNFKGELMKLSSFVKRADIIRRDGLDDRAAEEFLHREIIMLMHQIQDAYGVDGDSSFFARGQFLEDTLVLMLNMVSVPDGAFDSGECQKLC